ncbi:3-deoxy-manno-octulosonate cytidylyltransferase [Tunicatimonas pelagia]|uniref:3-deoxy-manno-octulosonate cytidylyltransferase n=1 Tax=Tunicatimonas pelagia TaxID=931531 RepID=UPI002665A828|nr:3-deoxy-manno-octulosonate cytidylyltransferase [Tunicatimonas pelagia]WKN45212.1 3-deoxy-manno-octulosonate cytidylyltransferase [Tunicatimonas pelagia]
MKILGIIPARWASSRFPQKVLADIGGKSMVQRVYEQALQAKKLDKVIVATDHEKIAEHIVSFGGAVSLTSPDHPSGTDRCREALAQQAEAYDYVINIQGDEPFVQPQAIDELAHLLDGQTQLGTLVSEIRDASVLSNPNMMKVIFNAHREAIYFSRTAIPYLRDVPADKWLQHHTFYKHVHLYAYRADILREITELPVSPLEKAESLEQLRWIENGYRIKVGITKHKSLSVDTPADLERAKQHMDIK